jgi:hypothetical protein
MADERGCGEAREYDVGTSYEGRWLFTKYL